MTEKIGIMGGTFDPVHIGHMIMASFAADEFCLDKVIFVPNGNPPHKKAFGDKMYRFDMTKLAVAENKKFFVSDFEISKDGYCYAIDTVRHFKKQDAKIYFIIGADSFYDLTTWHNFELLVRECAFIAFDRNGRMHKNFAEDIEKFNKKYNSEIYFAKMPAVDISSTLIRKRVSEGKSIKYLTHGCVENYIYQHNLYSEKEE